MRHCLKNAKIKTLKIFLVAHHREDQIETFLIRLSRGSGIQGLSAMSNIYLLDKGIKVLKAIS